MLSFNKIVNILSKKGGNIFFKKDIFEIIDPEHKANYQSKVDKTIYNLKAKGYIIPLKSGVYIIPKNEDTLKNKIDLIDEYFFKLLKKYIIETAGSDYYISGIKALEIHMKNFSLPEKIYIVNRNVNKKVIVGDYQIIFKTISGKQQGKKINLYAKFSNFTQKKSIEGIDFKVASLELALLEASVLTDVNENLNIKLLKKVLQKYSTTLQADIFYEVVQYKYIMSANRLKELSKKIDEGLYITFLDIIKQNGGLFIGEGLRGF